MTSGQISPTAANRYWFVVIFTAGYVVFAVGALLMPLPIRDRFWGLVGDLLHIPAFGLLNFLLLWIVRQHSRSTWIVPVLLTMGTITASGVIELVQGLLSRYASWDDLLRNALGAIASLLVFKSLEYRSGGKLRVARGLRGCATVTLAVAIYPPLASLYDIYRQNNQFPVLASFASATEMERWYVSSATVDRRRLNRWTGQNALVVRFQPGDFPAIQLQKLPGDWSDYRALATRVEHLADSPAETIAIQVRIGDRRSRRNDDHGLVDRIELARGQTLDWRFDFQAAQSQLTGRDRLQLKQISLVEWVAVEPQTDALVQFEAIYLEP